MNKLDKSLRKHLPISRGRTLTENHQCWCMWVWHALSQYYMASKEINWIQWWYTYLFSNTQLVMSLAANKGRHFCYPYAKRVWMRPVGGSWLWGHLLLNKISGLCSEWCPPQLGPSDWSHSNPFGIRMAEMPSFFNYSNMTSSVYEKRCVGGMRGSATVY